MLAAMPHFCVKEMQTVHDESRESIFVPQSRWLLPVGWHNVQWTRVQTACERARNTQWSAIFSLIFIVILFCQFLAAVAA
jgi:hypothetical protein